MKTIVKNLIVQYEDQGDRNGTVLLFLHGWRNDLHTFDLIVPELLSTHRIVRLDLPGSGGTEVPKGDWGLDDYVDFVDDFMKKIGIKPDVLIGHSLGGRIIIKGVARGVFHPKKIVLIASAGIAKRKSLRNAVITAFAKTGKAITAIPPFSSARENLRRKLYKSIGSDYGSAGTMKGTFLKVIGEDLSAAAAKISVPTLLIWGDRDTETPLMDGERLHKMIVGSELKVIPDTDHFVHQEKSEEVARIMKDFIAFSYYNAFDDRQGRCSKE
jgi:pimeloyl-ACP methyl ester carboxylesterase